MELILAESDLHLFVSCAYIESCSIEDYKIIWCGKSDSIIYKYLKKKYNISYLENKFSFLNTNYLDEFIQKNYLDRYNIKYLYTFYDTYIVFDYLRYSLKVPWDKVGLIDDGIANLFTVSMPKIHRRLPKALFNFITMRFPINLSRYNLGSNPRIKRFITLFEDELLYTSTNPSIINVLTSYRELIINFSENYFKSYPHEKICGNILTLSPILTYGRKTIEETKSYFNELLRNCDSNKPIYLKPHPRENMKLLSKVIEKLDIELLDRKIPMEIYFHIIKNSFFIGMPSTFFCLRSQLYRDNDDKFIIIQEENDPFPERIPVLVKMFERNKSKYKIL